MVIILATFCGMFAGYLAWLIWGSLIIDVIAAAITSSLVARWIMGRVR
jgi:hypothetical protein